MKSIPTPKLRRVISSSFQTVFRNLISHKAAGPPKLPPELERQIFETCAFDCPEVCTTLVLVCKRVYAWIDPILISTVCIDQVLSSQHTKLKSFLAKLTSGKNPMDYYARHVKNLALLGGFYKDGEVDRVLAICTGVENLASTALRKLYINLWWYFDGSAAPSFDHACFRNLTHLHLAEDDEMWPFYTGWEHLVRLSHLALPYRGFPHQLERVIQAVPAVRYVALCLCCANNQYIYADGIKRTVCGVHVVVLAHIPNSDWEGGARGKGDFWNDVEVEVERRLRDRSS
ncbi:hypothetical protein HYPSUDRAFT_811842 [Hypholoma sublateritium FD-334 SS-4]|uniref:F-box domain-containing protein n=1 Tax=Hypholoma sublateritium (strain FD-334 SS-4) TaxID=945553 RepID=A0A0D2PKA8_HYPSF|nr:hypothetical protein HYPSUDRAFT_811842 [Hypholoma sublateritium FD-334 SS-4]